MNVLCSRHLFPYGKLKITFRLVQQIIWIVLQFSASSKVDSSSSKLARIVEGFRLLSITFSGNFHCIIVDKLFARVDPK